MRCVSLRKFNRRIKLFAQVILPRNKIHLEGLADHILCIDEFRLGMAAQNCLAPGFATILYALTNSISEEAVGNLNRHGRQAWIKEYLVGVQNEVYEIILDEKYANMTFMSAVISIYKHHGSILFAISKDSATEPTKQTIQFCPFDLVLRGYERVYLIADQSKNATSVARFDFMATNVTSEHFWTIEAINNHISHIRLLQSTPIQPTEAMPAHLLSAASSLESLPERPSTRQMRADFTILPTGGPSKDAVEVEVPDKAMPMKLEAAHGKLFKNKHSSKFSAGLSIPPDVANHIVYCCLGDVFPSNLPYFLGSLRQRHQDIPVVFVSSVSPDSEDWSLLQLYQPIYYIVGTPLLRKNLRKANIHSASRTIIFADPMKESIVDRTADASALLTLLNVQAMSQEQSNFVTVEFIHVENMKLIGNVSSSDSLREMAVSDVTELGKAIRSDVELQNTIPAFCGGHVFSSTMFHSIICQAYYETNLIPVLKMFLFNTAEENQSQRHFFQ
ncbi:hypothetical protein HDU91_007319, partial [Kappamyces sp. JEL0680]